MNEKSQRIYLVWDYWIDHDTNKVYAIYIKEEKMYFLEQELKGNKKK